LDISNLYLNIFIVQANRLIDFQCVDFIGVYFVFGVGVMDCCYIKKTLAIFPINNHYHLRRLI
ncbi:hypothetical protein NNO04_21500, partial [Citrobacter sp. Awk 4]|uniref:hypothetical protein n=1 Tax=Citrobacter sp. Awk 4 TaxID=2963955 RepID=UPI002302E7E8